MVVVHHLNDSRSQRVLWLLEELGLPYARDDGGADSAICGAALRSTSTTGAGDRRR